MPTAPTSPFIVELDSSQALDPAIVGSKAASVADLAKNGATVPPGFAIPANAFDAFIEPAKSKIAEILAEVDSGNPASAFEASDAIATILSSLPTPIGLAEAIASKTSNTDTATKGLAVRSSATTEDLEGASFAGMYDSFLDATNAQTVLQRTRDVWASYYTGRAISYRQRQNISHENGSMAVLVMDLINADAGGVIFTRDPRDGTDQILINVALGLGEGVVSGDATADSFTLNSDTHETTNRDVKDKAWMFVQGTAGSTDRVPVPSDKRSSPALTDKQLLAVAKAAKTIKNSSGNDRDIEFALKDNIVHILQSRPITTGAKNETEFLVEWDNPEHEKLHWQTGGKTASLPLVVDYVYIQSVAEKRSVDYTGQYMGRMDMKKLVNGWLYSAATPRDPEELKSRLFKHHLMGRRYMEKGTTYYYETIEPVLLKNLDDIVLSRPADNAPIPDLIAHLRQAMTIAADHMNDLHWRAWAGFKPDHNQTKQFEEIVENSDAVVTDLTLGLDHTTSRLTKRLIGLAELVKGDQWLTEVFDARDYKSLFARGNGKRSEVRKFRARFKAMMKIWGCRNGLGYGAAWKPTDPSWNMKPEIPLDSIGSFVRQDLESLGRSHNELRQRRELAIRSVRKSIGRNRKLRKKFELMLFRATHHIKIMENHNYLIEQRTFGEYRESINRAGLALVREGTIDTPDDIYYLNLAQLESASASDNYTELRSLASQAKEAWTENSKLDRPDFIGTKPPEKDKDKDDEEPLRGISEDGQTLHGEPSSNGAFTGTARVVITRTSTPPNVKKGDILVTDNTGPDWVPIFPLIGALVLDKGDNFQHASLIAREYGIPCVIQTKEATKKIADAQLITVNGTVGTVTLNPMVHKIGRTQPLSS
ncbi:MAG TPA: hypothetical protein EYQ61_07800 [Dehalococcoidia bacterium]|nr:hypothetical protein [Dehalococcoidia bacterium]